MYQRFFSFALCTLLWASCAEEAKTPRGTSKNGQTENYTAENPQTPEEAEPINAIGQNNLSENEQSPVQSQAQLPQKAASSKDAPRPTVNKAQANSNQSAASEPREEQKISNAVPPPPIEQNVAAPAKGVEVVEIVEEEIPTPQPPSHSDWNQLLKKHVSSSGKVDYRGFKADKTALENYLNALSENPVQPQWSRNEKMAYWINAYNAFTIKKIVDNYPLKSITDLSGGKVWDVKWITLGDVTYSLNQIENDILRPQFKDARIHFAVNCAAKSCPPLLNQAFMANKLESQLQSQTKKFINNTALTTIAENSAEVSKIFEWYAVDFGDLREYLNRYSDTKLQEGATITYKEYDWSLNN